MLAYQVTNRINGKSYIGITSSSLVHRWAQHCWVARQGNGAVLHAAIRKYGSEAFDIAQIARFETKEELASAEVFLIKSLKTKIPYGYNLRDGGETGGPGRPIGYKPPPEVGEKISKTKLGKKRPPFSIEWKANMSRGKLGNTNSVGRVLSPEHRQKLSAAGFLRKHSDESRRKMVESWKVRKSIRSITQ